MKIFFRALLCVLVVLASLVMLWVSFCMVDEIVRTTDFGDVDSHVETARQDVQSPREIKVWYVVYLNNIRLCSYDDTNGWRWDRESNGWHIQAHEGDVFLPASNAYRIEKKWKVVEITPEFDE